MGIQCTLTKDQIAFSRAASQRESESCGNASQAKAVQAARYSNELVPLLCEHGESLSWRWGSE